MTANQIVSLPMTQWPTWCACIQGTFVATIMQLHQMLWSCEDWNVSVTIDVDTITIMIQCVVVRMLPYCVLGIDALMDAMLKTMHVDVVVAANKRGYKFSFIRTGRI